MVRVKIRQILLIWNHCHADASCKIYFLASKLKAASVKDLLTVNKVINKIKDSQYNTEYQPLSDKIKIALCADAAYVNHEDRGS